MDWDLIFSCFIFPGPFSSNLSKADFLNLTYPQLLILIKGIKSENEKKEDFHTGQKISLDDVPKLLAKWRKEQEVKNGT